MLRSFVTWFSLLIMATALGACCGSQACECNDTYADAISLQFSADSLNADSTGFRARQVDTVYLVRAFYTDQQVRQADTVQITRPKAQAVGQALILNNTVPFSQSANRKLDRYHYQLYLAAKRRSELHSFDLFIDSVQLSTDFRADGCCTCFENTRKLVYVDGNPTPIDLTDLTGKNGLVVLPVKRSKPRPAEPRARIATR